MDNLNKLILIGGGGHCKSCIDVIESTKSFDIVGVLDTKEKIGQKVLNYEIIGGDEDIERYVNEGYSFLITIGQIKTADLRVKIFENIKALNAKIATIVSPLAYVSKHAEISEGTIVLHHAIINAGAKVGKNCIINTKSLIEHDAVVKDHCHISTGAIVNGESVINEKSFIGSNSTVVQCISVSAGSFINAGKLVK